jgi:hypothetical protein
MEYQSAELKVCWILQLELTLHSILGKLDCDTCRTILQGRKTGQWLSVMLSTLNDTELTSQEFWDALLLCCGTKFCVRHALECKVGGLIMLRHNEINKELCNLASKALAP